MSTFGERLKELREEKNMFATQLAKILEVESATISNWEKDIRTPKKDMLIKIADYFDCSLDYLVGRTAKLGYKYLYLFEYNTWYCTFDDCPIRSKTTRISSIPINHFDLYNVPSGIINCVNTSYFGKR